MSTHIFVLAFLFFGLLPLVSFVADHRARASAAASLASALGLELRRQRSSLLEIEWELGGRWRDHDVRVHHRRHPQTRAFGGRGRMEQRTLLEVGPAPVGLGLRAEGRGARMLSGTRASMVTGDPGFDRDVCLWGDEATTRAILDAPTRARLLAALTGPEDEVSGGAVQLSTEGDPSVASLSGLLERGGALGEALSRRASDDQALLSVALQDPLPGVRARALLCLWRTGDAQARARAQDAAARHEDPALRAIGALMGGRAGELAPRALAEIAALAPEQVVGALERQGAEACLLALLLGSEPVQRAAVAALGRVGSARAVEPLLSLTRGLDQGGELGRLARAAVDRVQSRLGPADRGSIRVLPGAAEPGQVRLASQAEPGQIRLVRAQKA